MKKFFIGIFLFLLGVDPELKAQELPAIQTDRPGQTECPFIVPVKHFQMECGFVFEKVNRPVSNFFYPSALWKYGLSKRFELRLTTELITHTDDEVSTTGITPISAGFKARLLEEKGWIPTTSLIAHLYFPSLSSSDFRTSHFAPNIKLTMKHTLNNMFGVGYNLGIKWDGEQVDPDFLYTLLGTITFTEKLGAFVADYGFITASSEFDQRCEGGFTYLIKPHIQLDVSGGIGMSEISPKYYCSLGYSMRLRN